MPSSVKGTNTEQNLMKAFAGESQARGRYVYFAAKAREEGYEQIAGYFEETAENEKEHAKVFFNYLEGGDVEFTAAYPAGVVGDTLSNLKAAAAGEKLEWGTLYPDFKAIAKEEGFPLIAESFQEIAEVEEWHERRYLGLAARMQKGEVFTRSEPIQWKCRNCGYVHEGPNAPGICPACKKPRGFYEPYAANY